MRRRTIKNIVPHLKNDFNFRVTKYFMNRIVKDKITVN